MRLFFDHGTVVLTETRGADLDFVPDLLWDARVGAFRAPAWRYSDIVEAFHVAQLPLCDEVRAGSRPTTGPWQPIELRPYQQAASSFLGARRPAGIVVMPTGSGKTRVALAAMATTRFRVLCLVPTRALLEQWLSALADIHSGPIGCLGDGRRIVEEVTVATFELSESNRSARRSEDF